jgi:hypothetical protein
MKTIQEDLLTSSRSITAKNKKNTKKDGFEAGTDTEV